MTEHRRNIIVTACLEANAHYNSKPQDPFSIKDRAFIYGIIAEAYLMRVETITKGE